MAQNHPKSLGKQSKVDENWAWKLSLEVKYEALTALKVGSVDVHWELNKLIASWIKDKAPEEVGRGLAEFFEDFRELEEEAEAVASVGHELHAALADAVAAAGGCGQGGMPLECFEEPQLESFRHSMERGIEEMLKKRRKTMQQGLKEVSDAVHKVFESSHCQQCAGASVILRGARKVKALTRKMVVDYGTYIKPLGLLGCREALRYEALKSLEVGGVPVHAELNGFLTAWKLRSAREAGTPLGVLFQRFSTISGHDEF